MDISFLSKRAPYATRLYIWLCAYSLLMVGCFTAFQYQREKEFKADEIDAQLQLINTFVLDELSSGIPLDSISLKGLHPFPDLRISVISRDGQVMYDNSLDSLPHTNHLTRQEIADAEATGAGYALRRHSESTGHTYFYSARRGADGVVVRTAVPYTETLDSLLSADYGFLWFMGCITLLMCLLGYLATRRLGHQISRLNRFAKLVERGEKVSGIDSFPSDELGDISNNIVRLYARLQQASVERDREQRRVLHEQQEKQRIKHQLTNNINHELKTPVAGIQVCLETLLTHEGMSQERRRQFLERCMTQTQRLKSLLDDVSLITRMEDGSKAITMQREDLYEIIDEVVADSREGAAARGMSIHHNITRPLPIHGNETLLMSIFQNLVGNAISYSGGTEIRIRSTSAPEGYIGIVLSDNGSGVATEHLPHLFERFYRIDKGRSRATGGTGLGLSIVKNAILLHGGSVTVENHVGGGLVFRILLKQDNSK